VRTPLCLSSQWFRSGATESERRIRTTFASLQDKKWLATVLGLSPGRSARSLPDGRSLAPRERERARDQARSRDFQPRRSLRDRRLRELKTRALKTSGSVSSGLRFAARVVSQRGGGARRGSESARGTRPAVEALWPSRGPVRQKAQVPSKRKRRGDYFFFEDFDSVLAALPSTSVAVIR